MSVDRGASAGGAQATAEKAKTRTDGLIGVGQSRALSVAAIASQSADATFDPTVSSVGHCR